MPVDHFESSRRKIARAKEHFANLKRVLTDFSLLKPYAKVIEPDPNRPDHEIHKIKLIRAIPESAADITADIVQNLRNALDNAGYSISVAAGHADPKFSAFPFAGSAAQLTNSLGRSKDIPDKIQSFFCGLQPYRGGDDLLWALNEICIADKHKMLIPIGTGVINTGTSVRTEGFFSMPRPHVWDREKNEMELVTLGPGTNFKYQFDFRVFVAFNKIEIVDGEPVLGVLEALCNKVARILLGIETESRRLKIT